MKEMKEALQFFLIFVSMALLVVGSMIIPYRIFSGGSVGFGVAFILEGLAFFVAAVVLEFFWKIDR